MWDSAIANVTGSSMRVDQTYVLLACQEARGHVEVCNTAVVMLSQACGEGLSNVDLSCQVQHCCTSERAGLQD